MTPAARPHDLLWPLPQAELRSARGALPDWVRHDWPAVMRRAPADAQWLPVGLRGATRSLRHPAFLATAGIALCTTPESLSHAWQQQPELLRFASVAALRILSEILPDLGLPWGPTGSTGFALATGAPVLRADSDLDLLVRAVETLTAGQLAVLGALTQKTAGLQCRIDVQIDTGHGAFALSEWQRPARRVLLKTESGPVLTDSPWSRAA